MATPVPLLEPSLARVRVVLTRTSHPGNIGAAARALKTMGFSRLLLVAPKILPDEQSLAMASGADDVLAAAQVVDSLAEALTGTVMSLALTARQRGLATAPLWAREAAVELAGAATRHEVALVFGNETSGLSNDELSLCSHWALIPANPAYSSLNLAAAVQILCYELRLAMLVAEPPPSVTDAGLPATREQIEALVGHLEHMALDSGFLDPAAPKRLMPRLRRLFNRSRLEVEEVNILRGLLASFQQPTGSKHRGSSKN